MEVFILIGGFLAALVWAVMFFVKDANKVQPVKRDTAANSDAGWTPTSGSDSSCDAGGGDGGGGGGD
jgi:uncharacterized membrane protein YgcG